MNLTEPADFIELLGVKTIRSEPDYVELVMQIRPCLLQPFGFLHGGVTISLLETAASLGAGNNTDFEKERPFGVEVQIRHRKSGTKGFVRGIAELVESVNGRQDWKVAAYDEGGAVISDGLITTKIVSLARLEEKRQGQVRQDGAEG